MAAETWQMKDPRRAHPDHVVVDGDSAEAIEEAIHILELSRSPLNQGDGALRVHVLATLIAQAEAVLPDAVADARDQDHPWDDIAAQLGITVNTARRRYSRHHQTRSMPLDPD
jgi:2-keto-4-pentenoate hydratase